MTGFTMTLIPYNKKRKRWVPKWQNWRKHGKQRRKKALQHLKSGENFGPLTTARSAQRRVRAQKRLTYDVHLRIRKYEGDLGYWEGVLLCIQKAIEDLPSSKEASHPGCTDVSQSSTSSRGFFQTPSDTRNSSSTDVKNNPDTDPQSFL